MAKGKNDSASVAVGKPKVGGAVYIAPAGTEIPTDASAPLSEDFECIGYISEDGVTISEERDSEDMKAWGGDTVKSSQTSYKETFAFTPIEINPAVARMQYGDENVTVEDGKMLVKHNSGAIPEKVMVIETVPNSKTVDRIVVPKAQLTEKGDLSLTDSDPMGRESTFTALPDDSGNTAYEYMAITGLTAPAE